MAYRTYINDVQVFGNNEYYTEWLDFIRSKGITVGDESNYDGEIDDFMGALEVIEKIVIRLDDERIATRESLLKDVKTDDAETLEWIERRCTSLFDLSHVKRNVLKDQDTPNMPRLFDELYTLCDSGYLFMPIAFYQACKKSLELDLGHPTRLRAYKLKRGKKIHVKAG